MAKGHDDEAMWDAVVAAEPDMWGWVAQAKRVATFHGVVDGAAIKTLLFPDGYEDDVQFALSRADDGIVLWRVTP